MNDKELRIGNIIQTDTAIYEVLGIKPGLWGIDCLDVKTNEAMSVTCDLAKPIPLTEEWLLKCGFEYFREGSSVLQKIISYEGENYPCTLQVSGSGIQICRSGIGAICPEIKSVHQLQNLYFALTGKELEVKDV